MIITFVSFKNFYSFKDEGQMNFTVNDNAPQDDCFGMCGGSRFSKVSAIFGKNASGKTNLIGGFVFLKWFIARSFSYPEESFLRFYPFKTIKNKPSFFEVHFYIDDIFYKYCVTLDMEKILSEVLESRRGTRLITLYNRQYSGQSVQGASNGRTSSPRFNYKFKANNIHLEDSFIEKVRPNASIISTARQYNHPELTKITKRWLSVSTKAHTEELYPLQHSSKFYIENDRYFQQTRNFLKKADLGLSDIQIVTRQKEDVKGKIKNYFYPYGMHKNKKEEFELPFFLESGGTVNLYNILGFIFQSLEQGCPFIIDELEKNFHPNLLPAIIDLFIGQETNPKGAQLICTSHTPILMNDLSKYQLFLVEKTLECESQVYRLDEIEGVRSDDNFFKKYLAGAYGGVPDTNM